MGHDLTLAGKGDSMALLRNLFPDLPVILLHDRDVAYTKRGAGAGLLKRAFQQKRINRIQYAQIDREIATHNITHIISDNLYGVVSHKVPSALITHQLGILSPFFKARFDKALAKWIAPFTEVWVPDYPDFPLTGRLAENRFLSCQPKFLGILSPFNQTGQQALHTDGIAAILSGPEPQRTLLENKLRLLLRKHEGRHTLVRGVEGLGAAQTDGYLSIHPFLQGAELNTIIEGAKLVVCRAGYSSLMDLIAAGKQGLIIPTPQQPEQKYLASRMMEKGWFNTARQEKLTDADFIATDTFKPPQFPNYGDERRAVLANFLRFDLLWRG